MIGGPPMMMPGQPMFAAGPMPGPAGSAPWQQPPMPRYPAPPAQPMSRPRPPVLAEMAAGLPLANMPPHNSVAELPPTPRVRMQAADDVPEWAPRSLALPSPEELGIASSPVALHSQPERTVDWNATRQRLERMGVKSFRVDPTPAGAINVTFLLWPPGSHPRQVESTAATEAEALTLAIVETERYLREHR